MANADEETFELDPEAESELLDSIAEAERGELIPAEEIVRKLRQVRSK